jgi:hypothetical protein
MAVADGVCLFNLNQSRFEGIERISGWMLDVVLIHVKVMDGLICNCNTQEEYCVCVWRWCPPPRPIRELCRQCDRLIGGARAPSMPRPDAPHTDKRDTWDLH